MYSLAKLKELIRKCETELHACWDSLCSLKYYDGSPSSLNAIFSFQPALASVLIRLQREYNLISEQKKHLISEKPRLSPDTFLAKIRRLARFQEVITSCMNIGRNMGDAYAWWFYQNDREWLEKHLQHECIRSFPTGIGGIGEIEFLHNVKHLDGNLVIYHGTTNILRIGDVSFFELPSMKLSAIGELKTEKVGVNKLRIALHLVMPNGTDNFSGLIAKARGATAVSPSPMPGAQNLPRFKRQMKRMAEAFVRKDTETLSGSYEGRSATKALGKATRTCKFNAPSYVRATDGLLLVGFKTPFRSLFSRLYSTNLKPDLGHLLKDMPKFATQILLPSPEKNILTLGFFHMNKDFVAPIMVGNIPTFWLPIDRESLRAIYLGKTIVATVFNPGHLLRKIRDLGFEISFDPKGIHSKAVRKSGDRRMEITGLDYHLRLVPMHLLTEDDVIGLLKTYLSGIDDLNLQQPASITMKLVNHPYPKPTAQDRN